MTTPRPVAPVFAPDDHERPPTATPIVAAVEGSGASRAAIDNAVGLAADLESPLVFLYVRRSPTGLLGAPVHQRRLTKEMARARRVLDRALLAADVAEVDAEAEILEGSPRRRIVEFARVRGAQLVIVGSRGRRLRPSVACAVARAADQPVIVARGRAGAERDFRNRRVGSCATEPARR